MAHPDSQVGDLFAEMVPLDKAVWLESLEAHPDVAT